MRFPRVSAMTPWWTRRSPLREAKTKGAYEMKGVECMSRSTLATSFAAIAVSGLAMMTASASTIGCEDSLQKCQGVSWAQTGCPFNPDLWKTGDYHDGFSSEMDKLFGFCFYGFWDFSDGGSSKCDGNGNFDGHVFWFGDGLRHDGYGFGHDGGYGDHHDGCHDYFEHDNGWWDGHCNFGHDGNPDDVKDNGTPEDSNGAQTPGDAIPEPASLVLLGLGALGLLVRRFKNGVV
jgi:hypothetical protein